MGGALILPEADERMAKTIKTFKLTQKEISDLFKVFQKLDKEKLGVLKLEALFEACEEKRSSFTDAILDVLEIQHDGTINFSGFQSFLLLLDSVLCNRVTYIYSLFLEFLMMILSYCMFEPHEILKCNAYI
jgi:hypothetical protein